MKFTVTSPKITTSHLSRLGVLYIRRSSSRQVEEHIASGIYQRSFRVLAGDYGWEDNLIIEIDEDDGRSATDVTKRKGFQRLRQMVFEGTVGAIFCCEASRLARDNADFAQFIKLCGVYFTLIVDEKGVYDVNNPNDCVYLGFMGVINQDQSRKIGEWSKATKRIMAEAGELRQRLPTGYVYDDDNNIVFDPDEKVQEVFRLFFSTFDRLGSASRLVKHFNRNEILIPTRTGRGKKSVIVERELDVIRALAILHNPIFAGTYAYGLTKATSEMLAADATEQKKKIVKVSLDSDEPVIIHGSHEGYITREKFTENQKILEDNRYERDVRFKGAVRDGSALLQGLMVCGSCHWKLTTHYGSKGSSAKYVCANYAKQRGKYNCLTITTRRLDEIVTNAFLEAVSPTQLQLTLRELEEVEKETQVDDSRDQEELEKAKAECEKARLRFEAIEPQNKLVFREYEEKLQEKMKEVKRLEKKYAQASKPPKQDLTKEELASLSALPRDLRIFWECDAATNTERKQLLRCLISKVTVTRRDDSQYQDVVIHWSSGAITSRTVLKDGRILHPGAVELMRRLAPDHTIPQIIDRLHDAGFRPTRGRHRFSRESVRQAFRKYGIKLACPELPSGDDKPRGDGRYSAPALARMFNVSTQTINRWCKWGLLDGVRKNTSKSIYWIKITPEQMMAFKNMPSKRIKKSDVKKCLDYIGYAAKNGCVPYVDVMKVSMQTA